MSKKNLIIIGLLTFSAILLGGYFYLQSYLNAPLLTDGVGMAAAFAAGAEGIQMGSMSTVDMLPVSSTLYAAVANHRRCASCAAPEP